MSLESSKAKARVLKSRPTQAKQVPNPACRIFLHKILHPSSGKILKEPLFFQILRNLNGFFDFSIKKGINKGVFRYFLLFAGFCRI